MTAEAPEDGMLAAEYVLRLLPPPQEAAFEARLAAEPLLMREVAFWAARLADLNAEVPEVAPPARVRKALINRLFGGPAKPPFWQRAWVWQAMTVASVALAAFLSVQVLRMPEPVAPVAPAPLFIGEIASEDQALRVLAVYDPALQRLNVARTSGEAAAGRALELWAIPDGGAPISLGVLPDAERAAIALPQELRDQVPRLTLAISDEPPGGSTTGAPTGDVLAVGQVSEL